MSAYTTILTGRSKKHFLDSGCKSQGSQRNRPIVYSQRDHKELNYMIMEPWKCHDFPSVHWRCRRVVVQLQSEPKGLSVRVVGDTGCERIHKEKKV